MKTPFVIALFSLFILFTSCDRPQCENTNLILESNSIESQAYKFELAKEVERIGMENLSFWFLKYVEQDGKEFIIVNVQNTELCAKAFVEVREWKSMKGLREAKGKAYSGAELSGFAFDIHSVGESMDFIFSDVERIID